MSFILNQCETANELDDRFSAIRERIRDLSLANKLEEHLRLQFEQAEMLALNRIMDHQVSCACHLPR